MTDDPKAAAGPEPHPRQAFKDFVEYSLIWYSEQFAIPFWVVGQVHLHVTDYHADVASLASIGLHLMVALGFWLGFKKSRAGD